MNPATVDAERAVKDWLNSQDDLSGPGRPLGKGATLARLQGALTLAYALVSRTGGGLAFGAESPDLRAAMTVWVYGPSKETAEHGAAALVAAVTDRLAGRPVEVAGVGRIVVADRLDGPAWSPDFDEPRYIVTFDVYLTPL